MSRYLSKLGLFLLIAYAINSIVAFAVSHRLSRDFDQKQHWICSIEDHQFDYVFLGASRAQLSIDPVLIDGLAGTQSVNIAVGGGGTGDQFLQVRSLLQKNDVESVVYQVGHHALSNRFTYPFKDYVWLCYDSDRTVRQTIVDHRGQMRYLAWQLIPFLRLMEFSSQYNLFPSQIAGEALWEKKGGRQLERNFDHNADYPTEQYRPNPLAVRYFEKALDECRQSGVRVILIQTPMLADPQHPGIKACTELLEDIAEARNLEYWDFSRQFANRHDLFFDHTHLNSDGAAEFSHFLAQKLIQHNNRVASAETSN